MKNMREILRDDLGRSLKALPEIDRLRIAWAVSCGKAMSDRGSITSFEDGVVTIVPDDAVWLDQMVSMRRMLERELASIADVKVAGIHFTLRREAGSKRG